MRWEVFYAAADTSSVYFVCTFGDRDEVATTLISDTGSSSQTMKP
jgi:hypothetical protein